MSAATATAPDLEFTGERIVPGKTAEPLFREHEERYVFAGQYVAGKEVIDVACGTGVGTDYLRRAGAICCQGIDIDWEAIQFARARYPQCSFAQGDALQIRLPDRSVDVVVSFETIEHVADQRRFISECRRVLRPGGLLVCSSPNRTLYRWLGKNPYHVQELTAHELANLLSEHFAKVLLFSQGARIYPFYVARRYASRTLDRLRLKERVKRIVGWGVNPPPMRREFSNETEKRAFRIEPFRKMVLTGPMYVIAVCRKIVGE